MNGFGEDFLQNMMKLQPPTNFPGEFSKGYYSGFQKGFNKTTDGFLQGIKPLQGSEALPEPFQNLGKHTFATDSFNALIGKQAPQPNEGMLGMPSLPSSFWPRDKQAEILGAAAESPATGADVGKVAGDMDWSKIFSPDVLASMGINVGSNILSRATGSRKAGEATKAAGTTAMAAAQGFMNPVTDIMAIMSVLDLVGLF